MPPRANPVRRGNRPQADSAVQAVPQPQPVTPQLPPIEEQRMGVAANMISSLPPIASGADVYIRQFYRGSKVPFRRYLPINKQ